MRAGARPAGPTTFTYDAASNRLTGDATLIYDNHGRLTSINAIAASYLTATNDELVAFGATTSPSCELPQGIEAVAFLSVTSGATWLLVDRNGSWDRHAT
jgi:hypothetical protein